MSTAAHPTANLTAATLDELLAAAWQLLSHATVDRHAPLHYLALGTVTAAGTPEVRNVVLRAANAQLATLAFHTDRRSAKFAELTHQPAAALTGYHEPHHLQLRATGHASFADPSATAAAWRKLSPHARAVYASRAAPGATLATPYANDSLGELAAREQFAVITLHLTALDCLVLERAGHRRAAFQWAGHDAQGHATLSLARWVCP